MNISKIKIHTINKVRLITVISIILGILFDYFFYNQSIGINFPIYLLLLILVFIGFSTLFKKHIYTDVLFLLLALLFFSIMTFVRTSPLLTFLNIGICLFLLLILAKISFKEKLKDFYLKDYIKTPFVVFSFITSIFQTLPLLYSSNKKEKNNRLLSQILKGLAISIPILFVFVLLFSSADLIFQKYVTDLITVNIELETIIRIILVFLVSLILVGAYGYTFLKPKKKSVVQNVPNKYSLGNVEASVVLGSVNILFFLFILIQFTYFFGGESNISSQGLTYAQYARQGFFELITVGILCLFLLLAIEEFIVRKNRVHDVRFKVLSSMLIAQVGVIMASAFMRLSLYEETYGFTTLRLYSHVFIIFLAVVFCLLVYKIYRDKKENSFLLQVFVCVLLFLAGMNFLNPDSFIAKQNIQRFTDSGELDVYYLSHLSEDAIPEVVELLDILEDEDIKNILGSELYWRVYEEDSMEWQSFNISRARAKEILDPVMLEMYKDYDGEELKEEDL